MPNRRQCLLAGIAGLLPGIFPGAIGRALASGVKPVAAGIYRASGSVSVNGNPARVGMAIRVGDTIATGRDSEVIYVVGQDAYLLRGNSTLQIGGDSTRQILRIVSGRLLSVFGKGDKSIVTATATIGIRGTGCYIEAEPQRTYLCLCYGTADCVPLHAPDKAMQLKTRHHETPVWIGAASVEKAISAAPMINHTDAELSLLEGLVGRQPPFAGAPRNY